MAKNGISTLDTKELRQIAKLELAQTKRQLVGTAGYHNLRYYDLDLLPTKYVGNDVVDNPNVGGLQPGRPWSTTPLVSYTLLPFFSGGPESVNEGSGLNFLVGGTNIPDGTYYWTIETNAGDFATTSGTVSVTSNSGVFTVTPTADHVTEGAETFTVALRSGSITGPILVTSAPVTINDTSQTPTYSLATAGSVTSVNEGAALTFNITTTNVDDNTTLYWGTGDNFNGGDFSRYTPGTSGTVTIVSNSGSFTITISADNLTATSNPQEYSVTLYSGNPGYFGGTPVASITNIVVNDTSQTPANGLSVNWYGTTSRIVPTGSYTTPQAGAVTLPSGSYVNVGQNLQSTTFTVTVDANLNSAGSPWVVLWGNDSYTAQTGYVMYWNSTTNGSLGIFQSRFVNSTTPNITTAGRRVYTSVVNGLNVAFYINGTLINSGTLTGSATTIPNNNFLIGARHSNSGTLLPANNLDAKGGTYYSAKVQGTALTAAQVQAEWLAMPGAKTYAARQWLGSYSYGGNSGFYVLQSDYPNANLVPAGATVTVNGNAVATGAAFTSDTYSGQPVWYVFFTGSPGVVTSGTTLTFTWTV